MSSTPFKSVEGYVLFVSGIHEEAQEEQIDDLFAEYGDVKNIQVSYARKTGYINGYAMIEYSELSEAKDAIKNLNGIEFLGKKIKVDFAFKEKPKDNK